ncbi:MAG: hypothetical protein WDN06_16060 [Asticcacaulis sp.]
MRDIRLRMQAPAPDIAHALGGNFDSRWTAEAPRDGVIKHDIPAISTVRDVEVNWAADMPAYATSAVACEDFDGLTIDGLTETGDAPKVSSSLDLRDGKGVVTDRLRLLHPVEAGRPSVRFDPPMDTFPCLLVVKASRPTTTALKKRGGPMAGKSIHGIDFLRHTPTASRQGGIRALLNGLCGRRVAAAGWRFR